MGSELNGRLITAEIDILLLYKSMDFLNCTPLEDRAALLKIAKLALEVEAVERTIDIAMGILQSMSSKAKDTHNVTLDECARELNSSPSVASALDGHHEVAEFVKKSGDIVREESFAKGREILFGGSTKNKTVIEGFIKACLRAQKYSNGDISNFINLLSKPITSKQYRDIYSVSKF